MRDVLQQHLQPPQGRRFQISECRVGPLRRGERYHYAVQYDLRLRDPVTDHVWDQIVTGVSYGPRRTRHIWESLCAGEPGSGEHPHPSPIAPFAFVPELDMLVQVFPHDHRLPALAEMLAGPPSELAPPLLAQFGPTGWQAEEWIAESIRYRVDSRVTVRISLRASHAASGLSAARDFYAKIYHDDAEGRHAHATLLQLHERLEADPAQFSIATPVTYSERLRTLVQTEVPGDPMLRMIRRGQGAIPAVRMAARATADLHRLDLDLRPLDQDAAPRSLQHRSARLKDASELLSSARPDLANDLADIVSVINAGLSNVPSMPMHGDLKPDHFLVDGGRVALIDFDFLSASDPILDVANMESHLIRAEATAAGRGIATTHAPRVFVEEYFAHAPRDGRRRLQLYRVMASISEAGRSRRSNDPGWPDRIDTLLRQAQQALAEDS